MMSPEASGWDWNATQLKALMNKAADLSAEILREAPENRVTRPLPPELLERLSEEPAPEAGSDASQVLAEVAEMVAPYPFGNAHPRFFAWVNSPPHPVGVAAALLAAALNPSVAGGRHSAVHIEHQVVRWFLEVLGWSPPASHGLLTSGGSAATLTALSAARHRAYANAGLDDRRDGTAGARPVIYATQAAHSCVTKAVEALGIGSRNIHSLSTDGQDRMDPADLKSKLTRDRESGMLPVAVVASVGTVNTGAIDPIAEIARLCAEHDVWLHIDGAYGGPAALLLPEFSDLKETLCRVDSIALDPHKWLYTPIDAGIVLFRDAKNARDTFSFVPAYLQSTPSADEPVWLAEYGLEQTRPFRALKLWAQLRHTGLAGYRDLIARDIAVATVLKDEVESSHDFELIAHGLSVVCFRHTPAGIQPEKLDDHNRAIAVRLQAGGEVFIAPTTVRGTTALRACIVNPRTTTDDAVALLQIIRSQATGSPPPRQP